MVWYARADGAGWPHAARVAMGGQPWAIVQCVCGQRGSVHDDGNDWVCVCGRGYAYISAHVKMWVPDAVDAATMRAYAQEHPVA